MGDLGANRNWWQSHNAGPAGMPPQFRAEPTTVPKRSAGPEGPAHLTAINSQVGNAARARGGR